jgi:tRNA-intron endonuclease
MINGQLKNEKVLIEKPKEIGRLYTKSHFGKTKSGGVLELDLLESAFLVDENKLKIWENKKALDFETIADIASKKIVDFEIIYLAFKDLRKRGYAIKTSIDKKITFQHFDKKIFVIVFSEQDIVDFKSLLDIIKKYKDKNANLWISIVDEEGDITYYDTDILAIKGKNKEFEYSSTTVNLLKDRVLVFDKKLVKNLFEKEFYGKSFGKGLQLSIIESLYLAERGVFKNPELKKVLKNQPELKNKLKVFKDLKKRGLLVKTGFKFGTHFRAYTKSPNQTHAEYLIHIIGEKNKGYWSEISRAVRLAHSVNKEICFAIFEKNKIKYLKFGRLRP